MKRQMLLGCMTLPHSQTQTPNFTATQSRCGSRLQDGEVVPNGATLWRGCGSKRMLVRGVFAGVDSVIGTNGTEEERARAAKPESAKRSARKT